ncbi:MAG TPA: PAS domain-containing sensor histidine kinase [Ideonella sp.]|nr:PAS domain-containing sensor histidine kinase [Ideonella sp.]
MLAAERQFSQSLGESSRLAVLLCSAGIGLLGAILAWSGSAFALRAIALNRCNEERVRAANRRWALATAADGLGMVEWSLVGDTVELDTQACALYGLAPRPGGGLALRRKELRRVVHPDDLPEVRATVERCLLTGDDYKHAYRILLPGGGVRHIEVTGRFDADEGAGSRKAPARMVGIVRDVSREVEFRRLEAEKLAAEAAERHRAQLLSRVSHELRTPLNAVMGFSQLLALALDQRKAPDRAHLRHIETAAGHLLGLVDDLLDLTAMQAGDTGAEHRLLDLAMVIDSSLAMVEHQQIAAGVTVHHERPPSAVRVLGNEQRLRQVFVNLLSNGCKYNRPQGRLSVSYRFGGDGVMVDLQDQGLGLTPEQIKELFQPFRRLHRAGDRPGTGLGLVIAKSAVEQVGGRIEVASRPGTGSVFTVSLPTAEGESGLPDLPRLPVLLHSRVEDDRTLLLLPAVSSGVRAARPPTRRPA